MEENLEENEKQGMGQVLLSIGERLVSARRYILIPAFVLVALWFVGRGLEGMTHNTVFEPTLIKWIALFIFILFGLYIFFSLAFYIYHFISSANRKYAVLTWIFFALIIAGVVLTFGGYRDASKGFFALVSGSSESAEQALFLVFKFNSATPIMPIQLITAEIFPGLMDVESIAPFAWSFPILFAFFVWSLLYGSFLLMFQGKKALKVCHLLLALLGVFVMMVLKAAFGFTNHHLILLHAGAVILLFVQILLTYSSLRYAAENKIQDPSEAVHLLPPSVLSLALVLILLLPLLTDIMNQYSITRASLPIIEKLTINQNPDAARYVTTTQVSIRSGPALGDDIVGVLPKGTSVSALKGAHGWICIDENQWISPKFLRPVTKKLKGKNPI